MVTGVWTAFENQITFQLRDEEIPHFWWSIFLWVLSPPLFATNCKLRGFKVHILSVPCLQSFVVAVKYWETWAGPLCSISQGIRWTGARSAWPTDDTWTRVTLVLQDILQPEDRRGQNTWITTNDALVLCFKKIILTSTVSSAQSMGQPQRP